MCADFRGATVITMAEMRRLELAQQAEEHRLAEQAFAGSANRGRHRLVLTSAMATLGVLIRTTRRPRRLLRSIAFKPTSEAM